MTRFTKALRQWLEQKIAESEAEIARLEARQEISFQRYPELREEVKGHG